MNHRNRESQGLSCGEYEFDLGELADGSLQADREPAVRAHLAGCARCRAVLRDLAALDDALSGALPRPALSGDFDARLAARIAGLERTRPREVARAEAEREYRGLLDALQRGLRIHAALNALAGASVAGGVVVGLLSAGPRLVQATGFTGNVNDILVTVVTSLAVATGVVAARRMAANPFID